MKLIAHRGGRGFGVDNTVEAMLAAARAGARAIETDVRQTADGRLVICHDSIVRGRTVSRLSYEELKGLEPERPLLEELLEKLAGWCDFNLEIKEAAEESVGEMLDTYRIESGTLITSFNGQFLERFKQLYPGVRTGLLYRMPYGQEKKMANCREIGADIIAPHFRGVDREFVERAHGMGLEVYTWTVNDLDDLERLAGQGVDGIITDRYLEMRESMDEAGRAQDM